MPSTVYLSDLTPTEGINGWGPYERDRSNGESGATDGRTLTLNGTTYAKGLGVHSFSSLTYSLGGLHSRFQSFIGIDDEVGSSGSVVFRVLADGVEIFRSGTLTGASASQFVDLDVTGRQTLRLIVDDVDGGNYDHANWADAKLINATAPTATPPTITLAAPPAPVAENGTANLVYTFTRSGSTSSPLIVNYTVGGSATIDSDYTGITTAGTTKTVTFAAGSATAVVTVDPTADTTVEGNETVALTLAAGSGYTIGTTGAVTGTITNDDVAPASLPTITLAAPPAPVAENGTANLVYTFTRTGATGSPLIVNYTVGGTATNGSDYTGISTTGTTKTVTFAAGSTTAVVTVDPTAETTVEGNETVALTLAAGSGYTIGTPGAVTGTITNDDVAPSSFGLFADSSVPTAFKSGAIDPSNYELGTKFVSSQNGSISALKYYRGAADAADTDVRTLSLWRGNGTLLGSVTVTSPSGAIGWQVGSLASPIAVTAGETYVVSYGYVSNNNSGALESYAITENYFSTARTSPSGTLTAPFSSTSGGAGVYSTTPGSIPTQSWNASNYWVDVAFSASGTPPSLPSITLAAPPAPVAENGTANLVYTFTRSGSTSSPLIVNYTVGGTATIGSDYTGITTAGTTKTVSFAAGSTTAVVTVDPTAEPTVESNETVALTLAAGSGYTIGTTGAVTGTITNDDVAPASLPTITLAAPPAPVAENGTANLVYTFTRSGSTTSALSANYIVGGTATNGTDYTGITTAGTTKTVTFAAGSATASVNVDPITDTIVETDETVALTLAAGSGYAIGTPGAATGFIRNDDIDPITGLRKGWELNANNIGLAPFGIIGSQLPVYQGSYKIPAGSRISGVRFTERMDLSAGDIIIEKSIFQPTTASPGMPIVTTTDYNTFRPLPAKVIIRDSEIDGSLLGGGQFGSASMTAFKGVADMQRNYIHNVGSGIAFQIAGDQFDSLIENNYVDNLTAWSESHNSAFTIRDFTDANRPDRRAIIRNNRFETEPRITPTSTPSNASSSAFLVSDGRMANVTLEGNFLEGYGYNLWLSKGSSSYGGMAAIDNRFSPGQYGAAYTDNNPGWTTWQNNYIFNPTMPNGMGAPVIQ